jgi:hypothetical protein
MSFGMTKDRRPSLYFQMKEGGKVKSRTRVRVKLSIRLITVRLKAPHWSGYTVAPWSVGTGNSSLVGNRLILRP